MNTTLAHVEWEACPLEPARDRDLEMLARRAYGSLPPFLPYLAHCPWVTRAVVNLNPDRLLLLHLDFTLADLVSMVVSQENSCRFCFAVSRFLLRVQGMSEARVAELQAQLASGAVDPRTAAAVAFARHMARSQPPAGRVEREQLRQAGIPDVQAIEIAWVAAYTGFANRLITITAIPPVDMEQMPERWSFRLLRPLMARVVQAHRRHGFPAPVLPPNDRFHPQLTSAYAGSPIAVALLRVMDELWESPQLTRRCKALLFAVVATALDCRLSVDEGRRVLREEGLADATIDRALAHLQAPELDPVENLLLPFARDTIWYQPAVVQRRARELRDRLTPAQFVEAVGVLSLANALCRLAPAVVQRP